MDAEYDLEIYTFYDYVCDRKLLKDKAAYMEHAMILWDIHGNDYMLFYSKILPWRT